MKTFTLPRSAETVISQRYGDFERYSRLNQDLVWKKVQLKDRLFEAKFDVPLDWREADVAVAGGIPPSGKATLSVVLCKAAEGVTPHLGTIFRNPGGPGTSGVASLTNNCERLSTEVGGHYDIISWDPRGVGSSLPRIQCYMSRKEESGASPQNLLSKGLEARGNLTDQASFDFFITQAGEIQYELDKLDAKCKENSKDFLQFVGSTANVRDMVALADRIVGKATLINYIGVSYGTLLGSYFVNMHPDRVGRVMIDGVVNPEEWSRLPMYHLWGHAIGSANDALMGFAEECVKVRSSLCPLYKKGDSKDTVFKRILEIMDNAYDFYQQKRKEPDNDLPFCPIRSGTIRSYIMHQMYDPTNWNALAESLAAVSRIVDPSNFSLTSYDNLSSSDCPFNLPQPRPIDHSIQAITCSDGMDADGATTEDVFHDLARLTRDVSQAFAPLWEDPGLYCHRWTTRAVERFQGPWNHTLSNKILVIGVQYDPITPFASAKFVADQLGDSAFLLQRAGYGHTARRVKSNCSEKAIKDFFTYGTFPEENVCLSDEPPFKSKASASDLGNFWFETAVVKPIEHSFMRKLPYTQELGVGVYLVIAQLVVMGLVFVGWLVQRAYKWRVARRRGGIWLNDEDVAFEKTF